MREIRSNAKQLKGIKDSCNTWPHIIPSRC